MDEARSNIRFIILRDVFGDVELRTMRLLLLGFKVDSKMNFPAILIVTFKARSH